ncbi:MULTISPECIES: hypothetical protein [Parabacteroides]|uniref:Uncharacterized protein n=1 Tax=Parabacteroides chinchillae TaxID=871327 RepID=A0A8G2BU92_9BACT|nr:MULTISPECIES: hypothetical protein [Parabacteroides]SEF52745.1 hypothetical protein SAMN05444001_10292 [Parabacteroides chinchillae]
MNREKARRKMLKYRLALGEPTNDKLAVIYSVKVTTIRIVDYPKKTTDAKK